MSCAACGTRKGRRQCPALGRAICAACCGSKRQVEIACPADCGWLRSAQAHPAAAVQRQRSEDQGRLHLLLDRLEHGAYLTLTVCLESALTFRGEAVPAPLDADLQAAAAAMAATRETAERGVIYEHRPDSVVATRLLDAMEQGLERMQEAGATVAATDAIAGLRRVEQAVTHARRDHADDPVAFFAFLGRVLRPAGDSGGDPERAGTRMAEQALSDLAASGIVLP